MTANFGGQSLLHLRFDDRVMAVSLIGTSGMSSADQRSREPVSE
jgi:hypothetical protein